jgi:hypothetical protein
MTLFVFLLPIDAFAYIDPGSGSALIAGIIALLSAILFYIKNTSLELKNS